MISGVGGGVPPHAGQIGLKWHHPHSGVRRGRQPSDSAAQAICSHSWRISASVRSMSAAVGRFVTVVRLPR